MQNFIENSRSLCQALGKELISEKPVTWPDINNSNH